ncbi:psbV, partial [Symbiodinium necroappetens]
MQAQIRRVDLLDDRRWEWRHQVEEEMQKKCQGYEQQVQALASKLRSHLAVEDTLKQHHQRLQRLESELQRSSFHEEVRESFGHVCGRLELLEGRSEALVDKATADALLERSLATKSDDFVSSSIYEVLSKRLEDLGGRIEEALQDLGCRLALSCEALASAVWEFLFLVASVALVGLQRGFVADGIQATRQTTQSSHLTGSARLEAVEEEASTTTTAFDGLLRF